MQFSARETLLRQHTIFQASSSRVGLYANFPDQL